MDGVEIFLVLLAFGFELRKFGSGLHGWDGGGLELSAGGLRVFGCLEQRVVFGLGFAVWVECFGFGAWVLGFLGLRVSGWLGFWVRAERFGAWGV